MDRDVDEGEENEGEEENEENDDIEDNSRDEGQEGSEGERRSDESGSGNSNESKSYDVSGSSGDVSAVVSGNIKWIDGAPYSDLITTTSSSTLRGTYMCVDTYVCYVCTYTYMFTHIIILK